MKIDPLRVLKPDELYRFGAIGASSNEDRPVEGSETAKYDGDRARNASSNEDRPVEGSETRGDARRAIVVFTFQ